MIKKIRIKVIINSLKKYLKKFFFKLGYGDLKKVECKALKTGGYLLGVENNEYSAQLLELSDKAFEFYIILFENKEVKEKIFFDILLSGKFKLKVDIKPKKHEIEMKTKKQVVNLINRKTEIYLFRSRREREANICHEFNKPMMKSQVLDIQKLINISKKSRKE